MVYIPKRLFLCIYRTKKGIYDIMNLCMYPKEKKIQKKVLQLFNVYVILYSQGQNRRSQGGRHQVANRV